VGYERFAAGADLTRAEVLLNKGAFGGKTLGAEGLRSAGR
jgi:hypothetical protein